MNLRTAHTRNIAVASIALLLAGCRPPEAPRELGNNPIPYAPVSTPNRLSAPELKKALEHGWQRMSTFTEEDNKGISEVAAFYMLCKKNPDSAIQFLSHQKTTDKEIAKRRDTLILMISKTVDLRAHLGSSSDAKAKDNVAYELLTRDPKDPTASSYAEKRIRSVMTDKNSPSITEENAGAFIDSLVATGKKEMLTALIFSGKDISQKRISTLTGSFETRDLAQLYTDPRSSHSVKDGCLRALYERAKGSKDIHTRDELLKLTRNEKDLMLWCSGLDMGSDLRRFFDHENPNLFIGAPQKIPALVKKLAGSDAESAEHTLWKITNWSDQIRACTKELLATLGSADGTSEKARQVCIEILTRSCYEYADDASRSKILSLVEKQQGISTQGDLDTRVEAILTAFSRKTDMNTFWELAEVFWKTHPAAHKKITPLVCDALRKELRALNEGEDGFFNGFARYIEYLAAPETYTKELDAVVKAEVPHLKHRIQIENLERIFLNLRLLLPSGDPVTLISDSLQSEQGRQAMAQVSVNNKIVSHMVERYHKSPERLRPLIGHGASSSSRELYAQTLVSINTPESRRELSENLVDLIDYYDIGAIISYLYDYPECRAKADKLIQKLHAQGKLSEAIDALSEVQQHTDVVHGNFSPIVIDSLRSEDTEVRQKAFGLVQAAYLIQASANHEFPIVDNTITVNGRREKDFTKEEKETASEARTSISFIRKTLDEYFAFREVPQNLRTQVLQKFDAMTVNVSTRGSLMEFFSGVMGSTAVGSKLYDIKYNSMKDFPILVHTHEILHVVAQYNINKSDQHHYGHEIYTELLARDYSHFLSERYLASFAPIGKTLQSFGLGYDGMIPRKLEDWFHGKASALVEGYLINDYGRFSDEFQKQFGVPLSCVYWQSGDERALSRLINSPDLLWAGKAAQRNVEETLH